MDSYDLHSVLIQRYPIPPHSTKEILAPAAELRGSALDQPVLTGGVFASTCCGATLSDNGGGYVLYA